MITITAGRLSVSMAEPNIDFNTCRFNRAGFITSVVLDGKYEFCGDEHGGTKGFGLCSEITTDVMSADVKVGEQFPKFGVGILKKFEALPYDSQKFYDVDPYEITAKVYPDKVEFFTEPRDFNGYALREKKTVSIIDNKLIVDYEVENAGIRDFQYSEYCHNFLNLVFDGVTNWYNLTMEMDNAEFPYKWRLQYSPSNLKIYASDYFRPHHHNIWSPGFVISPEIYFVRQLAPGEKAAYKREYVFSE